MRLPLAELADFWLLAHMNGVALIESYHFPNVFLLKGKFIHSFTTASFTIVNYGRHILSVEVAIHHAAMTPKSPHIPALFT